MKCQCMFSGKNKKNVVNLSSAEFVQSVVMAEHIQILFFSVSQNLKFKLLHNVM